ncbi:MAG: hypothetical protein LQ352_006883 [Teloschistes flavicans]|nr:MAG: hypothetical protein LQ352_006883 [Teloschistes flavicans]
MLSYFFVVFLLLHLGVTNPANFYRTRVAYFQDNDPNGNFIVALKIDENDGTVSSPVRTSTGGKGLAGLVAISQDSVVVWQDLLLTTNSGDNTLSMLLINPNDPLHPQLIGKPAPTLGQTPVSVAYSPQHRMACATNGGSTAGVACFAVSRRRGLTPLGPLLEIPQTQKSDPSLPPAAAPLVLTGDIVFNPSSTALFVSFGTAGKLPGLLYAFAVDRFTGAVSNQPVVTSVPSLTFLFSMNFLASDQRMIVTSPVANTSGAAVLDIRYPSLKATVEKAVVIPDQMAACWVTYIPQYSRYAYVIDAAQGEIAAVDPRTDMVKDVYTYPVNTTGSGGVDTRIDREWLYLLTDDPKAPKLNVFAVQQGGPGLKLIQSFDIFSNVGVIPFWMGLAIWPSTS